MAQKFLDQAGVATLWAKIKANTAAAREAAEAAAGNLTVNGKKLSTAPALTADDVAAIPAAQKGTAGGVATLDAGGKVPQGQLPSYVDDVIEAESRAALPETGEAGKIYVALDSNKTYRWGGTAYVEISASLAIGTTQGTAYDGKAGADLATKVNTLQSSIGAHTHTADKITAMTGYTKAQEAAPVAAADTLNTAMGKLEKSLDGKAAASHTHSMGQITDLQTTLAAKASTAVATASANGLMSAADKAKLDGIASLTEAEINTICA